MSVSGRTTPQTLSPQHRPSLMNAYVPRSLCHPCRQDSCCSSMIKASNDMCSDTGAAPCIIDDDEDDDDVDDDDEVEEGASYLAPV